MEPRKRKRPEDDCLETSSGTSVKRILLLADKSREEEEVSAEWSQEENDRSQEEEDAAGFSPKGNQDDEDDNAVEKEDGSQEEDVSGVRDVDDNVDAEMEIADDTGEDEARREDDERFSEKDDSDSDLDAPRNKYFRKTKTKPKMVGKECPVCSVKLSNNSTLNNHLVARHFENKVNTVL